MMTTDAGASRRDTVAAPHRLIIKLLRRQKGAIRSLDTCAAVPWKPRRFRAMKKAHAALTGDGASQTGVVAVVVSLVFYDFGGCMMTDGRRISVLRDLLMWLYCNFVWFESISRVWNVNVDFEILTMFDMGVIIFIEIDCMPCMWHRNAVKSLGIILCCVVLLYSDRKR